VASKYASYTIEPSQNERRSSVQPVLNLDFPPGGEAEAANIGTIGDLNKQVLTPEESFEGYLKSAQAERIACFGEMAGGIAHEINNPLAIVRGLAEIMHKKARTGAINADEVATSMERMFLAVDRIVRVVNSIQIFAKTGEEMPLTAMSLTEVLRDLDFVFCGIACNHGIEFSHEGEADVCIDCRPGDLAQALFNIINNATEALKKTQAPFIRMSVTNSQGFVYIRISNNGPVVPTNLREKIFQPFFSTKTTGMSPGLGLSMSRAIAAGLGGDLYLEIDTIMTTFIFKLPISQKSGSDTSSLPQCQMS
jgi:C4-dicarboxylate-specific signal transduction histidine kinase